MALYLGIEITESQLKAALLRTAYKKLVLEGVFTLPRSPSAEGITEAARGLRGLVDQALSTGRPGQKAPELDGVFAALPGNEASLRAISLPRAVYRRGDKALMAELEGTVPYDLDDCLVDATVLGGSDPISLYAVAARFARVEGLVKALADAGFEPREVGVAPAALGELAGVIAALNEGDATVIVHCQDRRAELAVVAGGAVRFARTLNNLATPAARERQIRQSLAAWLASGGAPPSMGFVTGEEAQLGADALVAAGLDAERVGGLPQGTLEFGQGASPSALWEAPIAVAMSLRGLGRQKFLDLRKGSLAVSSSAQMLRERAPYLAGAFASMVLFWGIATFARYQGLTAERNRLEETLASVTQEVFGAPITDPEAAMSRARGNRDEVVDPMPGADAYDVLGVLSSRIPETVRHDVEQLDIQPEHVQLQGVVSTLQDRDRVVEAISQYACFPAVRPGRVTSNPDGRQRYTLDIEFRCPGAAGEAPRGARGERPSTERGGSRGGGA